MKLGQRIRDARQERGWSLQHLAELSQLSLTTIWMIETGKAKQPRYTSVERICRQLDMNIDYAIRGEVA